MKKPHNNGGRYAQIIFGEWVDWDWNGNRHQCCDCGSVHVIDYRINGNGIQARYQPDTRATKRIRKRYGIKLKRVTV